MPFHPRDGSHQDLLVTAMGGSCQSVLSFSSRARPAPQLPSKARLTKARDPDFPRVVLSPRVPDSGDNWTPAPPGLVRHSAAVPGTRPPTFQAPQPIPMTNESGPLRHTPQRFQPQGVRNKPNQTSCSAHATWTLSKKRNLCFIGSLSALASRRVIRPASMSSMPTWEIVLSS